MKDQEVSSLLDISQKNALTWLAGGLKVKEDKKQLRDKDGVFLLTVSLFCVILTPSVCIYTPS